MFRDMSISNTTMDEFRQHLQTTGVRAQRSGYLASYFSTKAKRPRALLKVLFVRILIQIWLASSIYISLSVSHINRRVILNGLVQPGRAGRGRAPAARLTGLRPPSRRARPPRVPAAGVRHTCRPRLGTPDAVKAFVKRRSAA